MSSGIVDMAGNQVSSGLEDEETEPASNGANPATAKPPKIAIEGLLILAACSDKVFRRVRLTDKQAQGVSNFMQAKCGGGLTLEPRLMLVQEIVRGSRPQRKWRDWLFS